MPPARRRSQRLAFPCRDPLPRATVVDPQATPHERQTPMPSRVRRALPSVLATSVAAGALLALPQLGRDPARTAPAAEAGTKLKIVFPVKGRAGTPTATAPAGRAARAGTRASTSWVARC